MSLHQVTDLLVVDGVKKFADSYHALLAALEVKRDQLVARGPVRASRRPAVFEEGVGGLIQREGAEQARRLLARDPSLWSDDRTAQDEIAQRLGWLELPRTMAPRAGDLARFADGVRQAGYARVVLLGMGGSSLAPETFARVVGPRDGFPMLAVLDSTDPAFIAAVERAAPLERTFFLVSSKSGTTLETSDLFEYFWERTGGRGEQFAAITDPGTALAVLGRERKLRAGVRESRPTSAAATVPCRSSAWCRPRCSASISRRCSSVRRRMAEACAASAARATTRGSAWVRPWPRAGTPDATRSPS